MLLLRYTRRGARTETWPKIRKEDHAGSLFHGSVHGNGLENVLGIEPLDAGEGRAVIGLDPEPVHLNHNGTVNAPILYALAEVAGAGAVVAGMLELAARSYTVVKRASIEYLAPAAGAVVATGGIPT